MQENEASGSGHCSYWQICLILLGYRKELEEAKAVLSNDWIHRLIIDQQGQGMLFIHRRKFKILISSLII